MHMLFSAALAAIVTTAAWIALGLLVMRFGSHYAGPHCRYPEGCPVCQGRPAPKPPSAFVDLITALAMLPVFLIGVGIATLIIVPAQQRSSPPQGLPFAT